MTAAKLAAELRSNPAAAARTILAEVAQAGGGLGMANLFTILTQEDLTLVSIADDVASTPLLLPDQSQGYRRLRIVVGADWAATNPTTFTGVDRFGAAQEWTPTLAPSATVDSPMVWALVTGYTGGGGPGGGASHEVEVQLTEDIGVSHAPVAAFAAVTKDGEPQTIVSSDLEQGYVNVGSISFGSAYEVKFSI